MPSDPGDVQSRAFAALDRLAAEFPAMGIALSGGGDSVALMHLASRWAQAGGIRLAAATVDHGLRSESAVEAQQAGRAAKALGLPHRVLRWTDRDNSGNLMANARLARQRLLAGWAEEMDLPAVLLGHTRDDIAETLLMRLGRGAGIDGLAAMSARREAAGRAWLRPLLQIGRVELRHWLKQNGIGWTDDPSNENEDFERVRARKAIAQLDLDPAALAMSAQNLAEARDALNSAILPLVETAQIRGGSVLLDRGLFDASPQEMRRRLIIAGIRHVTGAAYPPRRPGVDYALQALASGKRATLDGAVLDPSSGLLIHREPAAAMQGDLVGDIWDNRWRISGLRREDRVLALAADAPCVDWRSAGLTHLEAQALPTIHRGCDIMVPSLFPENGLTAVPLRGRLEFNRLLLGH
ncbi:tRNA lysidine(34) synthetase TilS [Paracoccus aerodenitrificans]|uniref:tRNA lysidine(34) synthetase TilS n=1 Tax=Paracoccus aerodenitrificans TaxID=3017781 RepID=UPI0022F12839|nr:tRNA lysidine(34) synthetase TilS [Paracoccus aerodenitrificans]WBU64083.1 tRNA lysidine(34) synthetase TilS [Paracoccus aerodenitrificans]